VLSFKGLSYNLSYGLLGILYALAIKAEKQGLSGERIEDLAFVETFFGFPLVFIGAFALLIIFQKVILRGSKGQ
jgi:hypothetical protein